MYSKIGQSALEVAQDSKKRKEKTVQKTNACPFVFLVRSFATAVMV